MRNCILFSIIFNCVIEYTEMAIKSFHTTSMYAPANVIYYYQFLISDLMNWVGIIVFAASFAMTYRANTMPTTFSNDWKMFQLRRLIYVVKLNEELKCCAFIRYEYEFEYSVFGAVGVVRGGGGIPMM